MRIIIIFTISERPKWELVAPRTGALNCVGTYLEYVVSVRIEAFDHQHRIGGVREEILQHIRPFMVEYFVENNFSIPVLLRRRVPLHPNTGPTNTDGSEILRSATGDCKKENQRSSFVE